MGLQYVDRHPLLLIHQHIDPLTPGQLLEFTSTEISVDEDFPAWWTLRTGPAAELRKG